MNQTKSPKKELDPKLLVAFENEHAAICDDGSGNEQTTWEWSQPGDMFVQLSIYEDAGDLTIGGGTTLLQIPETNAELERGT